MQMQVQLSAQLLEGSFISDVKLNSFLFVDDTDGKLLYVTRLALFGKISWVTLEKSAMQTLGRTQESVKFFALFAGINRFHGVNNLYSMYGTY